MQMNLQRHHVVPDVTGCHRDEDHWRDRGGRTRPRGGGRSAQYTLARLN